jgi:hydrogenase nickel incorporation protein HypA/HybF
MHELGITRNILEIAVDQARESKALKINKIYVVSGELSGVDPGCLSFYFDILRNDYALEDAKLIIRQIPAKLKCRNCQTEFDSCEMPWTCPACGSISLEIIEGIDCFVESIEVDN